MKDNIFGYLPDENISFKIDFNGDSYTRYDGDRHTHTGKDTYSRHEKGVDHSCPDDPPRTSKPNCDDIDTAETT